MNYIYWLRQGEDVSNLIYYKHKKLFKFLKILFYVGLALILVLVIGSVVSKAEGTVLNLTPSEHLFSDSSVSQHLITLVPLKDDYCICQVGDYDYYLFFGDLEVLNQKIIGSSCEVRHYVRVQNGYSYSYQLSSSVSDVQCSLNNYVVTSNLNGSQLSHVQAREDLHFYFRYLVAFLTWFIILVFCNLWRCLKREYN